MSYRATRGLALVCVCVSWACTKGREQADSIAAADSAAKAAAIAPEPPPPPLTDANIAALLDEANAGDSTLGAMAATKGTSASVKTFGRDMMRDHHALRVAGAALVKQLNLTPTPPTTDTLPGAVQRQASNLEAMPKGAAWDKAYIDGEVAIHQGVIALLQTAEGAATDTALKALIVKAIPTVDAHLKRAQDIAGKLAGATLADSAKKP